MVGVPCAVGSREAKGKASGQQSDSSEFRFTVSNGAGHPEGKGAGQSWGLIWASGGPSQGSLGPSQVSFWTDLQGAPNIFLPQDPGPVAGALRTQELLGRERALLCKLQPCERGPGISGLPISVCFLVQGQLWAETLLGQEQAG